MSEDKTIILIDKRVFKKYEMNIPENESYVFEQTMNAHGWRFKETGISKNKTLSISMDEIIRSDK